MKSIVTLEILDFNGHGGEHYYGSLRGYVGKDYKVVRLKYPMDEATAKYLNKKEATRGYSRYEVGQITERFSSEEAVYVAAKAIWKKEYPDAIALNVGSSCICDPQLMIAGPKDLVKKTNAMYQKMKDLGGYEGDEAACMKISNEYRKLLERCQLPSH